MEVSSDLIRHVQQEYGANCRLVGMQDPETGDVELMVETLVDDVPPQTLPMDVRLQVVSHVFQWSAVALFVTCVLGAIPLFISHNQHPMYNDALLVIGLAMVCSYILLVLTRSIYVFGAFWVFEMMFASMLCVRLQNLAPIQLFAIEFAQAATIVIYCHLSPRVIDLRIMTVAMFVATCASWCLGIYGYVVEQDWFAAIIIGIVSILTLAYNVHFVYETEGRYDASMEQKMAAFLDYFSFGNGSCMRKK